MSRPALRLTPGIDLSLYLVTDQLLCGSRGIIATVQAALRGGITVLQYRAKEIDLSAAMVEASALATMANAHGVPFIINDCLDLALAIDADGLHVGQTDIAPALARRYLGPDKILGLSITRESELGTIDPSVVDYIGLGPVFATATKADAAPALGLEHFRQLRQAIDLPVVAIGGIGQEQAADVIRAGADGIAVVSAICTAPDPAIAAKDLRKCVLRARWQS